MAKNNAASSIPGPAIAGHGAALLPAVTVDGYNSQLRDEDGFIGDRARRDAFFEALDHWRALAAQRRKDPFGEPMTGKVSKQQLDRLLKNGEPFDQAMVMSAAEDYAQDLTRVVRRLLRTREWRDTQRIVVGGGLSANRFTAIAIARAELLLRDGEIDIEMRPIRHDPDEAGLLGAVQLAPSWLFSGHDGILAVDIGGTNMRAGIIELNGKKREDLSKASVLRFELWRHAEEELNREKAIDGLVAMLEDLIADAAKQEMRLAPFIGIGCPGSITEDGGIEAGAQNLPGNWESRRFNLPAALREAIPRIGGADTAIVLHNDAVVQGLSQVPFMQDVERWGILTVGTGLGNARFTNRRKEKRKE